MREDSQGHQENGPKTQEGTNGETNTEDTLKARVPHWIYKECKKIGVKKTIGKEETRKPSSFPTRIERLTEPRRKPKKKI